MYHYPIAIEPGDSKRAYGVTFPDIPGCFSAGDTIDEAMIMAREALEGHLECLAEDGQEPPKPRELSDYVSKDEFKDYTWALVSIDPFPYMGKSQKVNVTMPGFLLKKIEAFVQTHPEYKDRSRFLQTAAVRFIDETELGASVTTSRTTSKRFTRHTKPPTRMYASVREAAASKAASKKAKQKNLV